MARRGGRPRSPRRRGPRAPAAAAVRPAEQGAAGRAATRGSRRWPPPASDGRAVVELLAHLDARRARRGLAGGGRRRVARRPVGGVPHLLQPVAGRRTAPPPAADPRARSSSAPGDVVGRYVAALEAGDADAVASTFAPDGYFQEPVGGRVHRGTRELRSYFAARFSAGGGIGLAALRRHRRRGALRPGVQLRPLGQPRAAAPGRDRRLRTRLRTGCWPRPASTTTWKARSSTPRGKGKSPEPSPVSRDGL